MALELTLWSDQKERQGPYAVELTVSGRRYTSKSTDACADFRVRKILNKKTLDQLQFQRMLKEAPEMKVLKQGSECQEKVILEEGHFKRYNIMADTEPKT